uniref:C3H1-type domain-containing protein n=1 Tax=Chromera velia CCMP2878 TaxID=1169474 RepID=A0A0G4F3V1_9ALVE|eukprot:Cvel_2677.t1-p1 / transcript=Cvel_2677.t1 / gene=Cvel_2677 / organism=Chromera_velia_CCMP2878 / gene_product=hypothetical protein / transcript_product=hypothetical protein / location=Cvel_scaffold107:18972-23435(-) / protein_length=989 / sequence_SO=supercontig / SO=protein_coding / is_pseudo=false
MWWWSWWWGLPVSLLIFSFVAGEPVLKCKVFPPDPEIAGVLLDECPVFQKLFPANEALQYNLVGSEGGQQVYMNKAFQIKLVYHEENEEFIEQEIQRSADEGTMDYLRAFSENVVGVWSFSNAVTGEALGFHYTTEFLASVVLPDRLHLQIGCKHKLEISTECILREFEGHIETGWEHAPCTYMGDCDDDCSCVEISPYLKQCVKNEFVTPNMTVVSGVQPVWPWDNCFYSRTCAVEGYQCFRNSRFLHYARCLPEGTCPRPHGREHLENLDRFGVRRLSEVTPQVFQRRVLEEPEKIKWPSSWMGRGKVEKRRRLVECIHANVESKSKSLFGGEEGQGEGGNGRESNDGGLGDFSNVDTSWNHAASEHVIVVKALLDSECKGALYDFMDPRTEEQRVRAQKALRNAGDEVGDEGTKSDPEEDNFYDLKFLDRFDDSWREVRLRRENGGAEGWECDDPHGDVATVENGAIPRMKARLIANEEGLRPWEVVPEHGEETRRRRLRERRRRLMARQERDGTTGHPEHKRRLQEFLFGFGPEAFLAAFEEEEDVYASLPPPPEEDSDAESSDDEDGDSDGEGSDEEEGDCGSPSPEPFAPTKDFAYEFVCAPVIIFAPTYELGLAFVFAPQMNWAPKFEFAPEFIFGPEFVFGPVFRVGPAILFGVETSFAPIFSASVEIAFAPVTSFLPIFSAVAATTLVPVTVLPDIFEDWYFQTTDFGPSKVKRFETPVVMPKEDVKDPLFISEAIIEKTGVREITEEILHKPAPIPLPEELLEKLKIRKSTKLGAFVVAEFGNLGLFCPQKILFSDDPSRIGHIRVFIYEPYEERLEEEGRLVLADNCTVAYPSDVLRDIPHLPPSAIKAIRAFEAIENTIPPPLKIAANQLLNFANVVVDGHIPDTRKWLREWGEFVEGKDYLGGQDGGKPISWTKAMRIAGMKTPTDFLKNLPSIFPKEGPLSDLIRKGKEKFEEVSKNIVKFPKQIFDFPTSEVLG